MLYSDVRLFIDSEGDEERFRIIDSYLKEGKNINDIFISVIGMIISLRDERVIALDNWVGIFNILSEETKLNIEKAKEEVNKLYKDEDDIINFFIDNYNLNIEKVYEYTNYIGIKRELCRIILDQV